MVVHAQKPDQESLVPEGYGDDPAARKLEVSRDLRGKARRQTAGLALQDIMVNTAVETANIDQTLFQALLDAAETRDSGKIILEDPLRTKLSYSRLITGAQVLARKLGSPLRERRMSA